MMKSLINKMRLENKKNKRKDKIKAAKLKQKQNKSANQLSQEFKQLKVRGIHTASDAFLMTYEWRKVRMEALKKYGARCQCCGATPAHGAVMNVDHIKPRKLFPHLALDLNNLQVLCHDCNHGKGNWDSCCDRHSLIYNNAHSVDTQSLDSLHSPLTH
ncbi:MAG: HNH endonuclease [Cytophagia bacterium]|nr:HNH endonuclease [Cytophagia bacterium]